MLQASTDMILQHQTCITSRIFNGIRKDIIILRKVRSRCPLKTIERILNKYKFEVENSL